MQQPLKFRESWLWVAALLALGVLLRLVLAAGYPPLPQPDTPTYEDAAHDLMAGGPFTLSEGRRTPGYPLFIAALGLDPRNIMLAQMALGTLTSVLLYLIALRICRRPGVAFLAALCYDLSLQQLFLEAVILTEPLTTFLLAGSILLLLVTLERLQQGRAAIGFALLTGLCSAAALMVRPQFTFMPLLLPLLVGYAALDGRRIRARTLAHAVMVALPIVVVMLGWAKVVQAKTGYFTVSNQSGFGIVNHSVEFIELAPERYAVVRDILLKYRAERIAIAGHPGNTVWYAWPEIRRATGWSLPEGSRQLQQMSMQMFAQHPFRYAYSISRAWLEFWTVPIFWTPERISPAWLAPALEGIWWIEHKLVRLANLLFVLFVAAAVVSRRAREAFRWDVRVTAISAIVLCSSLLQAMADRGSGSRYGVTLQATIVMLVILLLAQAFKGRREERRA